MASIARWIGRVLFGVVGLVGLAVGTIWFMGGRYLRRTYSVREVALVLPSDSAALARGEHLARLSCYGCHGDSLAGQLMFESPMAGRVIAPNALELAAKLTDAQLAGLLRFGVRPDGTSPLVMPPIGMYHMSDGDLAAVIAYLRTLPTAKSPALPATSISLVGRLGMVIGEFKTSAPSIDTTVARVGMDTAATGSRQGEYMARMICSDCHGPALTGVASGPAPSPALAAALGYSLMEFTLLLREGRPREAGKAIPNMANIATHTLRHLSDAEIAAIHAYLAGLPTRGVVFR